MLTLQLQASNCLTRPDTEALAGHYMTPAHYDMLVTEDADVYKPDGTLLLRFRKNVLKKRSARAAYHALRDAAKASHNRGVAGGIIEAEAGKYSRIPGHSRTNNGIGVVQGKFRFQPILEDGTVSKTLYGKEVNSGIVGFFDRYARIPYCRQTAYSSEFPDRFQAAMPYLRDIDRMFAELVPDRYAVQRAAADATHPDFVIRNTAFTTITVNKNFQTACHTDRGDLLEGFGNLSVLEAGKYEGGFTVFPQFRVAVDVRTCDFLAMDVHEWHGNTKIVGRGPHERISVVCYYRKKMIQCGSSEEELARAKRVRNNSKLVEE